MYVYTTYSRPLSVLAQYSGSCPIIRTGISVSQSHIATEGQSVCLSWCRASSGAHDQILITVWQLLSCPWEGALSDERRGTGISKSKSKLLYDWRFTANQFVLASSPWHLIYDWTIYTVSRRNHRKHIRCPALDIREQHRKQRFLYCCIYSPLHSNGSYPIVACVFVVAYCCRLYLATGCLHRICLRGKVFTELLPSNGCTCHNMYGFGVWEYSTYDTDILPVFRLTSSSELMSYSDFVRCYINLAVGGGVMIGLSEDEGSSIKERLRVWRKGVTERVSSYSLHHHQHHHHHYYLSKSKIFSCSCTL
jgi:hypothetical protein